MPLENGQRHANHLSRSRGCFLSAQVSPLEFARRLSLDLDFKCIRLPVDMDLGFDGATGRRRGFRVLGECADVDCET